MFIMSGLVFGFKHRKCLRMYKSQAFVRQWHVEYLSPDGVSNVGYAAGAICISQGLGLVCDFDQGSKAIMTKLLMFRAHLPASELVTGKGVSQPAVQKDYRIVLCSANRTDVIGHANM